MLASRQALPHDRPEISAVDMTTHCAKCGTDNDDGAHFCVRCGMGLHASDPAAQKMIGPGGNPISRPAKSDADTSSQDAAVPRLQPLPKIPHLTLRVGFTELWVQSRFWRMLVISLGITILFLAVMPFQQGERWGLFGLTGQGTCKADIFANQEQSYQIATAARTSASSLNDLKCLADSGNAWAQADPGELYDGGAGVPKDSAKALSLYRQSAAQENAAGEGNLAWSYYWGRGITQDYGTAAHYSRKSAEQGNATGELLLGWAYDYGYGVPQDSTAAATWYRKAADQGNSDAQNNLGILDFHGRGVPLDKDAALYWWRLSAAQGNEHAIRNLKGTSSNFNH